MQKPVTNRGYISTSSVAGRGVFAKADIQKGDLIETAPFLFVPENEVGQTLNDYVFGYDDNWNILVFGHGCMYNHAKDANVSYQHSELLEDGFDYIALCDIKADDELFISYGDEWWASRQED